MRKWLLLVLVLALVFAACGDDDATTTAAAGEWPEKLVFGFVPSAEQAELQDDIQPFMDVLEDALGIEIEGFVTTDYPGLGVALGTGQADIGAFATTAYVLAEEAFPDTMDLLLQSVRYGSPTYHGQYFVHVDNVAEVCAEDPVVGAFENINPDTGVLAQLGEPAEPQLLGGTDTVALQVGWTPDGEPEVLDDGSPVDQGLACVGDLNALAGKIIAFTEETSTSGYLFPALDLLELGIDPATGVTPVFSGSHDNAILSVYNGDAFAGVSYDDARRTLRKTNTDVGSSLIVVGITAEIPNDVVTVRSDLPDDLKQAIYDAIVDFLATEDGEAIFDEIYGWTDVMPASDEAYDGVRDARDEIGF